MGQDDKIWREMVDAIDVTVLQASERMRKLEILDGKSTDYKRGFIAGVNHQSAFTVEMLLPGLKKMNAIVSKALRERGIEP
jgi:hypothetical protein